MNRGVKVTKTRSITVGVLLVLALLVAMTVAEKAAADAFYPETGEIIHTIWWKAKTTGKVRTKYGTIPKGRKVTVVNRGRGNAKCIVQFTVPDVGTKRVYVSRGKLSFISDLATRKKKGDYSAAAKEWFVNRKLKASSKTNYFIWVSLDKQIVNVFTGKKGHWKLLKAFKCASGKASTPTAPGYYKIYAKYRNERGNSYYSAFQGNGFHVGNRKGGLGTHTASHGCVRLGRKSAVFIYDNVPMYTKVYVY